MATHLDHNLQPTVSVLGNLRRLRSGAIWADYRMTGLPYGYTSDERKYDALVHHKNFIRNLPNNSVVMALVAAMDPDAILARAMAGTDVNANLVWREECEGKHEYFTDRVRPTERVFTLSIPVVESDTAGGLTGVSGRSRERDAHEMSQAADIARTMISQLPAVFRFEPLTAAQMVWLWNRAISRGGEPTVFPAGVASNVGTPAGGFASAEFDEDHRRSEVKRWRPSSFAPLLKITQPDRVGAAESWQTLMAIEAFPLDGLQFPGAEFFTIADRVEGFDIDWALRIHKKPREQAIAANNKKLKRLAEQLGERDSEISFASDTLFTQRDLLGEYTALLESNDDEVQVEICPMFSVAATSRRACEEGALKLLQEFDRVRIKLVAPLGGQRELFAAMNPGGADLRAVTDFSHETISEFAAACVPCATSAIGDEEGPVFALNLSGRRNQPVHFAWWREATKDASPSVAVCGELGAGKTWAIMTMLQHLVDAGGGQFLSLDRTDQGEYATLAASLPRHTIVDLMRPAWSLDPLRIFPPGMGVDRAVDLLTPLFNCAPESPMGLTLGELLRPEYGVRSIPGLLQLLQDGVDRDHTPAGTSLPDGWSALCRHLSYWSGRAYAAAIMDPNLAPADLTAQGIVVRTNRVEVPTLDEILSPDPLPASKVFGRAIYGLSAEIGRQAFGSNKNLPGAVALDEIYTLTASPGPGLSTVQRLCRDGRKDNTALIAGAHQPAVDFPKLTALDLIRMRLVMRHSNEALARSSLEWLGIDPDRNPHIVRDLTSNTSPKGCDNRVIPGREGEGYMRDARGAIGRIKVLGPSSPARRAAMSTTPPEYSHVA